MKPLVIAVVGPSCSGKSTVSKWLASVVKDAVHIELDDFFIDMNKRYIFNHGFKDLDRPSNLKWNDLRTVLHRLKQGKSARVPHYSKHLGRRDRYRHVTPKKVIIVEGYLLLYRKFIQDFCDYKVFLNISEKVQYERREATYHSPPAYVREVVIPIFRKYGIPERNICDVVVDSSKPLHKVEWKVYDILEKKFPWIIELKRKRKQATRNK